jgi:hypothetical protein
MDRHHPRTPGRCSILRTRDHTAGALVRTGSRTLREHRLEWLDIAITYGLLNVISTLAILKFFRHGDLAYDAEEEAVSSWALAPAGTTDLSEELPQILKEASLVCRRREGSTRTLVSVSIVPP